MPNIADYVIATAEEGGTYNKVMERKNTDGVIQQNFLFDFNNQALFGQPCIFSFRVKPWDLSGLKLAVALNHTEIVFEETFGSATIRTLHQIWSPSLLSKQAKPGSNALSCWLTSGTGKDLDR
jgi:hypothetical protein